MASDSMENRNVSRQLHFDQNSENDTCNVVNELDLNNNNCAMDVEKIHSIMPKEMIPAVGMQFDSEEKAFEFYLAYSEKVGFGVRKSTSYTDKFGNVISRTFVCSAEGKREKDVRDATVKSHRAETRFDCQARIRLHTRHTKKFHVTEFKQEHTHYLTSPRKTQFLRSHRKVTPVLATNIEMANDVGIAPKAAYELLAKQAGGRANVGFIPEDYKNYLRSKRTRDVKTGDTGGVLEYLHKKQFEDPNFFYAIQVDEDDLITNIFWSDAKMRTDFSNFGDVVSFDTTYRKNNEGRPIALFVGVNHHKQTVIFGAALLYDETSLTFEWLFDTFTSLVDPTPLQSNWCALSTQEGTLHATPPIPVNEYRLPCDHQALPGSDVWNLVNSTLSQSDCRDHLSQIQLSQQPNFVACSARATSCSMSMTKLLETQHSQALHQCNNINMPDIDVSARTTFVDPDAAIDGIRCIRDCGCPNSYEDGWCKR